MLSAAELVLFLRAPSTVPRRPLRGFARRLRDDLAGGKSFHSLITDDRELRRLNRRFLYNDYPTDVLSFPSESDPDFLGEVAISYQRATHQAHEFGHSLLEELKLLMLHGLLHLKGMDHAADRGRMARAEARWRARLGLPAGLIARMRP